MITGIGLNLGAIQCHMAQAHHAGNLAEPQDLNKQTLERIKVAAAKITDPAVVRLLVTVQHQEGQVLVTGSLDLPGGDDADAVGLEQQNRQPLRGRLRQHPPVESLLPTRIFCLGGDQDLGEIQLANEIQQEINLVVF